MPRDDDHLRRIREFGDHERLLALWDAIQRGDTPGWDAGRAFEHLVLRGFELEGATVRWPYGVRFGRESAEETIEQIDGVVYCEGLCCLCEMKDHQGNINAEPIAKMRNQLLRRPAGTIGAVFARKEFTDPAVVLARFLAPQTVLLWTGAEVEHSLRHGVFVSGLVAKYRHAVEHGLPDLEITEVELQGRRLA